MPVVIVTNNTKSAQLSVPGASVVAAKDYLLSPKFSSARGLKVINLCRSYAYQTDGYYVSLLAVARGHRIYPGIRTIQETKALSVVKIIVEEIDDLIVKTLSPMREDKISFPIYFGKTARPEFAALAQKLFRQFPAPLLRADFTKVKKEWRIQNIQILSLNDIPDDQKAFMTDCIRLYCKGRMDGVRRKPSSHYDLAILFNEEEEVPPSDKKAIDKFIKAAEKVGFNTEIIGRDDYDRLSEFDALFIRETTNVNHYTYRFSQRAEADGLVVIDDPLSILRCTNKVYLAELLNRHKIPAPKTIIINRETMSRAIKTLGYPTILKEPDGSFSQGVMKVVNREDFRNKAEQMFENSDLILAQEFMPTDYDWRIGILDNEVLYACRYYMAKEHWQIVNWKGKGGVRVGKWDCVKIRNVPSVVIKTALRAARAVGSGLYGVDLKLVGDNCYVIEVNDNPSIETGVEDIILKDNLYTAIMRKMYERVRVKKEGSGGISRK
jgi:glutathione synthase/RimK-type ligase-like ATP-grasp enzyme